MGKNPSLVLTYYNVSFLLTECICDFVPLSFLFFYKVEKKIKCRGWGVVGGCCGALSSDIKDF